MVQRKVYPTNVSKGEPVSWDEFPVKQEKPDYCSGSDDGDNDVKDFYGHDMEEDDDADDEKPELKPISGRGKRVAKKRKKDSEDSESDSDEDDDFARTALDVSEKTCFLHAFCRTDLKARVKVSGYKEP